MEIQWGDFYFQCERTVAIIIALAPAILVMQLPPTLRLINKIIRRMRQGQLTDSLPARIKREEQS